VTAPHPAISRSAGLRAALGGMFAIAASIGIGRFIYTPILPPMIEALGLSKASAGLIASANFTGYLCGAVLATVSLVPGSRRGWLLGALAVSAATTGAMGLATTVPAFLLLRFAGGVASALALILSSALVLETLAETGRTKLAALHFAGAGIGILVSSVLIVALQALGQSWPALWYGGGALSLLATIAVAPLIADRPVSAAAVSRPAGRGARGLVAMAGAYGLFGFGYVITATFIVTIVRTTPAIRPLEPMIWIVVGIAATPSVTMWSWLARRFGIPAGFAVAAVVEAAGVVASVAWQSAAGIFVAAILLGGTFMGLVALGLMRARELATGDPRRAIALLTGAFGIGQIIGPIFAGALYDRLGDLSAASYAAAAALLAAAVLARR
jgi:MFS family permease